MVELEIKYEYGRSFGDNLVEKRIWKLVEREMSKNKNKGLILLSYNPSQIWLYIVASNC